MRVIDCQCGQTLQAANDDELEAAVRDHANEAHPEMGLDDDQVKALVADQAYTATDA